MKLTILKENLNNGLNIIGGAIGKNLTLPILNNILISIEKNLLNLSTTNLEIGIKYWALAKIEKEGKITVPFKLLFSLINSLPEKKITLEAKNQILYIDCENYKIQINGQNAEDFPIIPKIETPKFLEFNNFPLCEGISQVVDFSTVNQVRPELSGIYFSFKKDKIRLVATDSFRLAEKTLFVEKETNKSVDKSVIKEQEYSFILPQRTAREIINILSERKGKLKFYFSPNQVLFEYPMTEISHPQVQIISRLIEGEYPDYEEIIPKKYEVQIVLPKNEFLKQTKIASLFSGKINEIQIKFNPQKEGIEIFSQNSEFGENKSFLSGKINYGSSAPKKIKVAFNYKFLVEGLLNIKSQKVIFELNGEEGPAVLRPEGDTSYVYVVMPIKAS